MPMKLDSVKRSLESMRCRKHGKHPTVKISDSSLNFECCCEAFEKELIRKAEALIAEQAKRDINGSLRNMFK